MTTAPTTDRGAPSLTIIGGGVTGLASAYLAAKAGWRVSVLEASSEFGGLLRTFAVAGTRLEFFYHHFFTHDAELHWLLEELGIEDALTYAPSTMGILRNGGIFPFDGPKDLLPFKPLPPIDKLRFALTSAYLSQFANWRRVEEVSSWDWLERFAGRKTVENIWGPLLEVKFGSHAREVPLAWLVGRLRQRVKSRSAAGSERLGYLRGSLQGLLDALLEKLRSAGVKLVANAPVGDLIMEDGVVRGARCAGGDFRADHILATIPTVHLSRLVAPHAPDYADDLAAIQYFSAVCTILKLRTSLSPVYWLNIADPGFPFGGIIEHTRMLPPEHYEGHHIVYLSKYFPHHDPLFELDEAGIQETMMEGVRRFRPGFEERDLVESFVFRTDYAAPVCDLGFSKRVPACRSPVPGLFVASMPHVYPDERSVNNSIRVAANAIDVLTGERGGRVPTNQSLAGRIGFDLPARG